MFRTRNQRTRVGSARRQLTTASLIFTLFAVSVLGAAVISVSSRSAESSDTAASHFVADRSTQQARSRLRAERLFNNERGSLLSKRLVEPSAMMPPIGPTITVDRTDDSASLTASLCTVAPNDCSLRGAIIFANTIPGTTIIVPAGTYQLTIDGSSETGFCTDATIGDLDISGDNTTIMGAGAGATIIQQTEPNDRVLCVDANLAGNFTFHISGVTITGGRETFGVGGGGMISGAPGDNTVVADCVFSNNQASGVGSPVGGGIGNGAGSVTITGSTFDSNSSVGSGAGVYDNALGAGTLTVTNCAFSNNTSTGGNGGGLLAAASGGGGPFTVTGSSFSGNQSQGSNGQGGGLFKESGTMTVNTSSFSNNQVTSATGKGGGIANSNSGSLTANFNRIVGNTANTGSGASSGGGTFNANDNWWGCNSGPGGASGGGCTVSPNSAAGLGLSAITWLQLRHTASPSSICPGATSTLSADIKGRNIGSALTTELNGLPAFPVPPGTIFNNASLGTLSGASTQFIDGSAAATFTAGSTGGNGSADATADNQTVTASITVNANTSTTDLVDQTVCQGATASFSTTASGTGPFHYAWTVDGSSFDGDNSSISVPTGSLTVGNHPVTVTVSGTCGSVIKSATLTVKQNTSTTKPNDQVVCAGSTASFSTTASGTGPFTFVWKKGSTVLNNGDLGGRVTITSGSTTSTLTISNVQSTDAGTYSVATTGACGTATQSATLALDSTPPTITCPSNITVEPTCPSGAVVTYTAPVGTDNCPGAITTRTAGLASGSVFPIGTTTVTYTVTDTSGNSASCSFTVTVKTPAAAIQDLINSVQALINQGVLNQTNGQGLINKLQAALSDLNSGNTGKACDDLDSFIDKVQGYIQHGTLTSAQGQPLIDLARKVKNTLGCNGTSGTCT